MTPNEGQEFAALRNRLSRVERRIDTIITVVVFPLVLIVVGLFLKAVNDYLHLPPWIVGVIAGPVILLRCGSFFFGKCPNKPLPRPRDDLGQRRGLTGAAVIVVVVITGIFLEVAQSAIANTFQRQDGINVVIVSKELLSAERDNIIAVESLNAEHRFNEVECLSNIITVIDNTQASLQAISDLVLIISAMWTPYDERIVIEYLQSDVNLALKSIQLGRRHVNNQAGFCGESAIIQNRAQTALSLLSESESIVLGIRHRL